MSSSFLKFMFFDGDWKQRQELDAMSATAEGMADNMANIGAQMTALRSQVHELSVTVAVMIADGVLCDTCAAGVRA